MITRKIGFLLFDNVNAQDLVGPLEVFHAVGEVAASPYRCQFIACEARPYRSESGLSMLAEMTIDKVDNLDTLIVPGGCGSRNPQTQSSLCPWLQEIHQTSRRLVSVCTGAFLLAASGLLNGKKATTHWAHTEQFRARYPEVDLVPDELFVDNGDIATSAGITSGIDLSLKLVEDDLGTEIAAKVARYLVVHFRRAGDQAQFSIPLQFQAKADSKFAGLTGWILQNLSQDLSVEKMADYCGMSERNFCRRFNESMQATPGRYVEQLRLDYARQLLSEKPWPISRISEVCGYHSADVFRRAFERRFSVSPKSYRARFAVGTS